jgi:hypothetical protein
MKKIFLLTVIQFTIFSLLAQVPTITSFSPVSGIVGTLDTINGTNFSSIPSDNIVYFGAVRSIVINATTTMLIVKVPVGATYQPISVTVRNLTALSSKPFIVTFSKGNHIIVESTYAPRKNLGYINQYILCNGDIDGDGKVDLITRNTYKYTFTVFRNTSSPGNISFDSVTEIGSNLHTVYNELADFNGDGKLDLAFLIATPEPLHYQF